MNFLKKIPRWGNLLLIIVTLLAYLSPFIDPEKLWHLTFAGLAYPVLLLANLLFIIYWLLRKSRYFLFSTACILAGFGYFSSFLGLRLPAANDQSERLEVMTFNIAGLSRWRSKTTREEKFEELQQLLGKRGRPDILCLQESAQTGLFGTLKKALAYPHYFKEKGTIIFSEHPIGEHGIVPFKNTSNSCIWVDLETPLGTVRTYCVHLQSNRLTYKASLVMDDADPRKKQTWRNVRDVMRLYKRAVTKRAEQAKLVAAHLAESPHPVLLCGDLNDMPVSYVYRLLSQNLMDSFCEKGSGFGATYNGNLPALRIDYVLCSESLEILSHEVPPAELSDHLPVIVGLKAAE